MYRKLLLIMALLCPGAASLLAQSVETVTSGLFEPYGVAVDPKNNAYYFTDSQASGQLLRYHPNDNPQLSTVGLFNNPQGLAFTRARGGAAGALVLAETSSHKIWVLPVNGSAPTVIGGSDLGNSDGSAGSAKFRYPYGVAVDDAGNIYVADNQNGSVRKISTDNNVTTFATGFNRPSGVAVGNNQIFVTDTGNGAVVTLDMNGARIGTVIGGFTAPRGLLWMGGQTGLLVSDGTAHVIWSVNPVGGTVREFAGMVGRPGSENGAMNASRFRGPTGLAVDNNGWILVADLFNTALRSIKRQPVTPPSLNLASGFYNNAISLAVTNEIVPANAEFRYTSDGSEPNQKSTLMEGNTLVLNGAQNNRAIIKVRGFSPDFTSSTLVSNTYSFYVEAPAFNIPGGNFTTNINLEISTLTEGATITYSNALTKATGIWNGTQDYGQSGQLIVRATRSGYSPSAWVANNFGFTVTDPSVSPEAGQFNNSIEIAVNNETPGTAFHYTLNGVTPTSNDPLLPGNFSLNANTLTTNTLFTVRGFKDGYTNSAAIKRSYSFKVAPLAVSVPSGEYNNHTNIFVTTSTEDVQIRYTVNGQTPTADNGSVWVNGEEGMPFGTSGRLIVRAFKTGYLPSEPVTNNYNFIVTPITIVPSGGAFTNDVAVKFVNQTAGTVFKFTRDGSSPGETAESSTGTIVLNGNRPGADNLELVAVGTKSGYTSTPEVQADFQFNVADPVVTPSVVASGFFINSLVISARSGTTNAVISYSLNGSDPSVIFPAAGLTIDTTNTVKLQASRSNYNSSGFITVSYPVRVDRPVLSPANGFFPSGGTVTVSVARSNARIHYSTDGSDPTTNSPRVSVDGKIKVDSLVFPIAELRTLKVRAFADNVHPSEVVSGEVAGDNSIGIPGDLFAANGSKIVVPVVLNLKQGQEVRSFQFNVKVYAKDHPAGQVHNVTEVDVEKIEQEDLIKKPDGSLDSGTRTNWAMFNQFGANPDVVTNVLSVFTKGLTSGYAVKDYGFVALVSVKIPNNAVANDKYVIEVSNASATEDGFQKDVPLTPLAARTITVKELPYLVGDTSPAGWYNSGDFGNGKLDNSDVNNALYATLHLQLPPYDFSDIFNAMDVFPEPGTDPNAPEGGDLEIRFLDYQKILHWSLGLESDTYKRSRNSAGDLFASNTALGGSPFSPAETLTTTSSGDVWFREGSLTAMGASRVEPGQTAQIPLWINVLPGKKVSGLMFRAQIVPINEAPAVTGAVSFSTSQGISSPQIVATSNKNEVAAVWDLGMINPAITDRKQLGTISFKVPADAKLGQAYRVQFVVVDGAPDARTQYNLESFPAWVWIKSDAPDPLPLISDEWKLRFFGSVNAVMADALADADGDGIPNWKEFLAGTNPTDILSRLHLARPELRQINGKAGVALKFLSASGRTYVIESTTNLASGEWTVVAEGLIGDGSFKEFINSNPQGIGQFYRVRLK